MLVKLRRTISRLALAIAAALASILIVSPAYAGMDWGCGGASCQIEGNTPGGGGSSTPGGGGGGGNAPAADVAPGPTSCSFNGKDIPCSSSDGVWGGTCYWKLSPNQTSSPGSDSGDGAWYRCSTPSICTDDPNALPGMEQDNCTVGAGHDEWLNSPPAGIEQLTPRQAANRLVKQFTVRPIDIGIAPTPDTQSYVGVPIWMWVNNEDERSVGPWTITGTLGGQTITMTAKVGSIRWDMGDGGSKTCGAWTAYQRGFGYTDSPTCGYRYSKTSGDGRFTVNATSQWQVNWTGGGDSGTIPLTQQSSTSLKIGELQSVNVTPTR